jgi:arsenate reductase
MVLYGIKNCNTVKSAVNWLKRRKIRFEFHDYKVKGITDAKLKEWSKQVGWEALVNKRGTTWRMLDQTTQASVTSASRAFVLMKEKTSVIRRPLIERDGQVILLGFDEQEYSKKLP